MLLSTGKVAVILSTKCFANTFFVLTRADASSGAKRRTYKHLDDAQCLVSKILRNKDLYICRAQLGFSKFLHCLWNDSQYKRRLFLYEHRDILYIARGPFFSKQFQR